MRHYTTQIIMGKMRNISDFLIASFTSIKPSRQWVLVRWKVRPGDLHENHYVKNKITKKKKIKPTAWKKFEYSSIFMYDDRRFTLRLLRNDDVSVSIQSILWNRWCSCTYIYQAVRFSSVDRLAIKWSSAVIRIYLFIFASFICKSVPNTRVDVLCSPHIMFYSNNDYEKTCLFNAMRLRS